MGIVTLDIDNSALRGHTKAMQDLHRSVVPNSVRGSLNRAALDVKQVTMPKTSKTFKHRAPTFFKATSKVSFATGYDISQMRSTVGFVPQGSDKEKGGATKDLEQQEHGGVINKRTFIPLKAARTGKSDNKQVSEANRLTSILDNDAKVVDAEDSKAKTQQGRFFSSARHVGKGGYVIGNKLTNKGSKILFRINKIVRKNKNTEVYSTALYTVKSKRDVRIKSTRFMEKATWQSGKKLERFYIEEAEKQVKKRYRSWRG